MQTIDKQTRQTAASLEKKQSTQESKNSYRNSDIVRRFGKADSFLDVSAEFMRGVVRKGKDECFFGNYPTLSAINAAYHRNMATAILMSQITELSEYCGCKGKVSEEQTEQCAEIIVMTYPYLKISELAMFFAWFKAGRYGRFYGSIDPLVITCALRDFIRDRNDVYFRHEAEETARRREEASKGAVSYQEYLRMKEAGLLKDLEAKVANAMS